MVGKLIKHEWIRTRWWLLGVFGLPLVFMILFSWVISLHVEGLSEAAMIFAVFLLPITPSVVPVVLAIDYWRSSYRKIGYLTQTYPIKGSTIFWAKYGYGAFWSLIGILWAVVLGLVMALGVLAYGSVAWDSAWPAIRETFEIPASVDLSTLFPTWFIIGVVVFIVLGALTQPASYYFSISVGCEAPLKHLGIAGPIVVYLVQGFVVQVISALMTVFIPVHLVLDMNGPHVGVGSLIDLVVAEKNATPLGSWPLVVIILVAYLWRTVVSWQKKVSL